MNTKARLMFVAVAGILLLGAAEMLSAIPIVSVDNSISIAPSSIPVPESGNVIVGMNRVRISTPFSGGTTSVDQVVVQLIASPALQLVGHPVDPRVVRGARRQPALRQRRWLSTTWMP